MRLRSIWYPILGLGMAVAGADKLMRNPGYERMFRRFGWTRGQQQASAALEVLGGLLLASPRTRRLGGVILAGESTAVLAAEIKAEKAELAVPRVLVLTSVLKAIVRP